MDRQIGPGRNLKLLDARNVSLALEKLAAAECLGLLGLGLVALEDIFFSSVFRLGWEFGAFGELQEFDFEG